MLEDFEKQWFDGNFPGWPVSLFIMFMARVLKMLVARPGASDRDR